MSTQEINTIKQFAQRFRRVLGDLYAIKNMYDMWRDWKPLIDPAHHIDVEVRTSVPTAGELEAQEIQFGDGTGPNGRDELYWSVDGSTVARVEADSIIT